MRVQVICAGAKCLMFNLNSLDLNSILADTLFF